MIECDYNHRILFLLAAKQEAANNKANVTMTTAPQTNSTNGELDEETIMRNREKLFNRGKKKVYVEIFIEIRMRFLCQNYTSLYLENVKFIF